MLNGSIYFASFPDEHHAPASAPAPSTSPLTPELRMALEHLLKLLSASDADADPRQS